MLVSVYMPTKNRLDSLTSAVNSVLNQTHKDIELIVVDDASSDGTQAYLSELQRVDSRVKYIRQEVSKGACVARNLAIKASGGEFLTGLDDDDEFVNTHISAYIDYWQFLEKNSDAKFSCLYSAVLSRKSDGLHVVNKRPELLSRDLLTTNYLGNQIFSSRDRFFDAGLYDEEMPAWQDLEFFFRMLKQFGPAKNMPLPTYIFDEIPRPDRISVGKKSRVVDACKRMTMKHSGDDPRLAQHLLLQIYADHYGFDVTLKDVLAFIGKGLWPSGYKAIIQKYLKQKLTTAS